MNELVKEEGVCKWISKCFLPVKNYLEEIDN